ncbi:MAG: PadR family transcriptional regulator [Acidobacteriota bacterium]
MSLEHILLSFLDEPMSGYDLKKDFEAGAAMFWPAQLSQIYPTLRRMQARGWLAASREASSKGPKRWTYVRTEDGTQELKNWLRSGPQIGRERFAYIGQLSAMGQLNEPAVVRDFLVRLRQSFAQRCDYLEEIEGMILGDETPESVDQTSFFDWAALRMGVVALESRRQCCDELLTVLERRLKAADEGSERARKEALDDGTES